MESGLFFDTYVIIVNWNSTQSTLLSISNLRRVYKNSLEIIVVDNGSDQDQLECLIEGSDVHHFVVIRNGRNSGYSGANNIGIKEAIKRGGQYFWLLNADTEFDTDVLSGMKALASRPDSGVVSPHIYFSRDRERPQFLSGYFDPGLKWFRYAGSIEEANSQILIHAANIVVWGTSWLISKNVIDSIGYLDEGLFAYWEDVEYSLRCIKSGFVNRVDFSARIYHDTPLPKEGVVDRAPYVFFYSIRNSGVVLRRFCDTCGVSLIQAFLTHLKYSLDEYMRSVGAGRNDCALACMDGLWASWRMQLGEYDPVSMRMPAALRWIATIAPYRMAKAISLMLSIR